MFNLQLAEDAVSNVEIVSTRPVTAASLFVGKTAAEVLALVPNLFSVCGTAQSCAAIRAVESALGLDPSPEIESARERAVWAETAREHLIRLAGMVGETRSSLDIARIMPLTQGLIRAMGAPFALGGGASADPEAELEAIGHLETFLVQSVFRAPLDAWLALGSVEDLQPWIEAGETDAAGILGRFRNDGWREVGVHAELHPLPSLDATVLLREMKSDDYIARPTWNGGTRETTPLSRRARTPLIEDSLRRHGAGLVSRTLALLSELADIPGRMRGLIRDAKSETLKSLDNGFGLAQVEAARGRLVHAVRLDKKRVVDYRILAPTEWNFHPHGVAAQALKGLSLKAHMDDPKAALEAQADMMVSAIDPCVSFEVRTA